MNWRCWSTPRVWSRSWPPPEHSSWDRKNGLYREVVSVQRSKSIAKEILGQPSGLYREVRQVSVTVCWLCRCGTCMACSSPIILTYTQDPDRLRVRRTPFPKGLPAEWLCGGKQTHHTRHIQCPYALWPVLSLTLGALCSIPVYCTAQQSLCVLLNSHQVTLYMPANRTSPKFHWSLLL